MPGGLRHAVHSRACNGPCDRCRRRCRRRRGRRDRRVRRVDGHQRHRRAVRGRQLHLQPGRGFGPGGLRLVLVDGEPAGQLGPVAAAGGAGRGRDAGGFPGRHERRHSPGHRPHRDGGEDRPRDDHGRGAQERPHRLQGRAVGRPDRGCRGLHGQRRADRLRRRHGPDRQVPEPDVDALRPGDQASGGQRARRLRSQLDAGVDERPQAVRPRLGLVDDVFQPRGLSHGHAAADVGGAGRRRL